MTAEAPDVLTSFLGRLAPDDASLAADVAQASPRLDEVVNGLVVVLSPADAQARKRLLEPARRARLERAAADAGAAGWRIDPPRPA